MWKIILSNMKEKKGAYFVLFVELTLLMFLAFWVFQMLIPYLQEEVYYRQNHLDRYVFFSMDEYDEKALEAVAKQIDQVTMLGESIAVTGTGSCLPIPVYEEYFSDFDMEYLEKLDFTKVEGNKVVIPRAMAKNYKIGKTYTFDNADTNVRFDFTVVGILKNNIFFTPPHRMESVIAVDEQSYSMLMLPDDKTLQQLDGDTGIYLCRLDKGADKTKVMEKIKSIDGIVEVKDFEDTLVLNTKYLRQNVATPMVLFVTAFLVGLASIWSHILLSAVHFRRKYNICYICGVTWRKCLVIQWISDLIPILCAMLFAVLAIYKFSSVYSDGKVIVICILVVVGEFMIGEMFGSFCMRKGNVMENLEEVS